MGDFGYWFLSARRLGYWLGPWAEAALATTFAVEHPRASYLLTLRAHDHLNHRRLNEAERDARRAIELLAEDDIPFSPGPWSVLCMTLVYDGRAKEVEGADAFLDAARATGDDDVLVNALIHVALWWYILDDAARCLPFAEEAAQVAQRFRNPSFIATAHLFLGASLIRTEPIRARAVLETAVEQAMVVGLVTISGPALSYLGRLGADLADPQWAGRFRDGLSLTYEAGDEAMVLMHIDLYTHALALTDRAEVAAVLAAAVAGHGLHLTNPISVAHRRMTRERLVSQLGEERLRELSERGAALNYDEAVALTFAELDRAIASDDREVSSA
jgi:hypothetical protein